MSTSYTSENPLSFIQTRVENEAQRADSLELIHLFKSWSGWEPRMWGTSIIGFGNYHYKYASGHEGDAPVLGFSPRKSATSLYVYSDTERSKELLAQLGKYKMGKSCIYVKSLKDINKQVLEELSKETIAYLKKRYGVE
ncbi:DUF1801 domain-containing protein [Leadbetterella byssophila]|uniref:DUF1801 domain-containing protein n=1 Tax=Leadbetterella byssophila TaxID=316068 RepID=UPI0039A3DDB2